MSTEVLAHTGATTRSAAPAPSKPESPSGGTAKDPLFSNAKLALIVLVVVGHSWGPLFTDSDTVRAFYMTLYDFHMPAFILVCGYFSQSFSGRPHQMRRLVTGVAAPYFIFALLYGAMRYFTEDEFNPSLLTPYYLLWFLAALFVWRITAPIWKLVRYPLVVALVISIGASTMELPKELDLGRILQFLPFFVAGLLMKREHFEKLRNPVVRIAGPILSVGILAAAFFYGNDIHIDWIYYTAGATQLDVQWHTAIGLKLVMLAAATVLIATFFAWVPDKQLSFTRMGELTMYPFLLHGFFIKIAEDGYDLYDIPFVDTGAGAVVITLTALVLAFVLLSKPIRWMTSPLVEPKLNWILKPTPRPPSPRPRPQAREDKPTAETSTT
ncbi:acyltransferase family protein [Stackebrandtia nassauensis]|uniref:Acyltransferase 3 n=1 Tax=Stackebrandtia nassauensis (strain DSM 44728 / CIP 108903 / NRRL B-16338 / NBRC 102104 / LLR-40K-21) TaxID=446470 RepID=D3Q8N6_STANL|nr:acyltransferase family protein [Stackebrandtia nassauensis]ADD44478.1 acyltransferase 3 [Stackebrandtia nassauensis DSM 44728]